MPHHSIPVHSHSRRFPLRRHCDTRSIDDMGHTPAGVRLDAAVDPQRLCSTMRSTHSPVDLRVSLLRAAQLQLAPIVALVAVDLTAAEGVVFAKGGHAHLVMARVCSEFIFVCADRSLLLCFASVSCALVSQLACAYSQYARLQVDDEDAERVQSRLQRNGCQKCLYQYGPPHCALPTPPH